MKTRAGMIARLRKIMRDKTGQRFDDDDLVEYLKEAWAHLQDRMMEMEGVDAWLRRVTAPRALTASVGLYAVPADHLRSLAVEWRSDETLHATLTTGTVSANLATFAAVEAGSFTLFCDDRLYRITGVDLSTAADLDGVATVLQAAVRAATGGTETVTWDDTNSVFVFKAYSMILPLAAGVGTVDLSSSTYLNGVAGVVSISAGTLQWSGMRRRDVRKNDDETMTFGGSLLSRSAVGSVGCMTWDMHMSNQYVQLEPLPQQTRGLFRVWYYAKLPFPAAATDTLMDLPDGLDDVVIYEAAVLAVGEEPKRAEARNHFLASAQRRFDDLMRGRGSAEERSPYMIAERRY